MIRNNKDLEILNCASNAKGDHIVEKPRQLSCGHLICDGCVDYDREFEGEEEYYQELSCDICNKQNKENLWEYECYEFEKLIQNNIDELFKVVSDSFKSQFDKLKDEKENTVESIHAKIQFVRENIEIRIESLKIELDELKREYNHQLDQHMSYLNGKLMVFDEIKWKKEVDAINKNMLEKRDLNEKRLYEYQDKLLKLNNQIRDLRDLDADVKFEASEKKIDENMVGFIKSGKDLAFEHLISRIKSGKREKFVFEKVNNKELCVVHALRNNYITVSDGYTLYLYNPNLKLVKTFKNDNFFGDHAIEAIDSNDRNEIYISTYDDIYKLDLNLKVLEHFMVYTVLESEYILLNGMCYSNGFLYTCDSQNKCIYKLDRNLSFIKKYKLPFSPSLIKIIGNVACVTAYYGNVVGVTFYLLDDFKQLNDYKIIGNSNVLSTFGSYFFIYNNGFMYCYDQNGESFEKMTFNVKTRHISSALSQYKNMFIMDLFDGFCYI